MRIMPPVLSGQGLTSSLALSRGARSSLTVSSNMLCFEALLFIHDRREFWPGGKSLSASSWLLDFLDREAFVQPGLPLNKGFTDGAAAAMTLKLDSRTAHVKRGMRSPGI